MQVSRITVSQPDNQPAGQSTFGNELMELRGIFLISLTLVKLVESSDPHDLHAHAHAHFKHAHVCMRNLREAGCVSSYMLSYGSLS